MNDKNEMFKTTDLCLATTLLYLGHQFLDIEKIDPKRVAFGFEDSKELRKQIDDFWSYALMIEPMKFYNLLRVVKARIHDHL